MQISTPHRPKYRQSSRSALAWHRHASGGAFLQEWKPDRRRTLLPADPGRRREHAQDSSLLAKIEAAQRPRLDCDPETHFSAAAERHRAGYLTAAEAWLSRRDLSHACIILMLCSIWHCFCCRRAICVAQQSASIRRSRRKPDIRLSHIAIAANIQARLSNFDQARVKLRSGNRSRCGPRHRPQ